MKINKNIWALALLFIVVVGCKKTFLEEKRDLTGVNEEVFKDSILATAYVDYIYGLFQPPSNSQAMIWDLAANGIDFTRTSEELPGQTNWNREWADISYTNAHALPYFGVKMTTSVGNNTWTRMKQINIFLNEVDNYGLPESTRNKLKGQLYFWRAYQYFDLVRLYGGVPLVLQPQNPITTGPENEVQRSKTSETIEQVIADLDKAISMLPGKWDGPNWGRITSGGAAALKGRVLLTWASPLFNRTDERARWKRAYDANLAAKTLLEANGFGLYKKGSLANASAWGNMWFEEANNPEAVIVFGFNNITSDQTQKWNGWEQAARPREMNGAGSISPTKQMVDAFPMKDGKMPGESATYNYTLNKFYKNRDPRFYKTFAYNGALWPMQGSPGFRIWTYRWFDKAADATPTRTTETKGANASGIYVMKATNPSASNTNGNFSTSGTDFMELRFAEVVLNLAEAAIGNDQLVVGLDGIKQIRERAGVENLDGSYGLADVSGRDALFAAVLNERKVEFAYEGKRFWDLRRWMLFNDDFGTVSRLGMEPINGTRRTGYFISVKKTDGTKYTGGANADPLLKPANGNAPVINRDSTVTNFDQYLDHLYDTYFQVTEKNDLDPTNPANWAFKWYNEYYFFGFNQNVLSTSPYLEQTKGWNGIKGAGTFEPLQ
jgi:starch-binding outer membrane protein, SusD/RagB family